MNKVFDELRCYSCERKLSKKNALFETAWSGVYWCGSEECAGVILHNCCDELDYKDPCNHED